MTLEVGIRTTNDTKKLLKEMPRMIRRGLVKGMEEVMEDARKTAQSSFGKPNKPRNITGQLRDSIKSSTKVRGDLLMGSLFSNRIYARIQEEGGIIRAKDKPLRFSVEGAWRTATMVRLPSRAYLKPAIDEHLGKIRMMLTNSVLEQFKE